MTSNPLVSVVTPSYNQGRFIEETLASVRNQTYDRVEHIVVDGGSDDGTLDILQAHDDSIRWLSEDDDGQSDAINKGFDMAEGDIVGWLNSDDVFYDTEVLDRVVSYFDTYDADVVYGDMALLEADSDVMKFQIVPKFDYGKLLRYCFIEQPALFFTAGALEGERLNTDLAYVMDYEFWLRLARDHEFRHVDDVLAGDRNHENRKILHDREQMKQEGKEMRQSYGAVDPDSIEHRIQRLRDKLTSGMPRRLKAVRRTLDHHRRRPELAFDGELYPRSEMIRNVFRPNRVLL